MTTPWTPDTDSSHADPPGSGAAATGPTYPPPGGGQYPAPAAAHPLAAGSAHPAGPAFPPPPPSGSAFPPPSGSAFPPPSGSAFPPPSGSAFPPPGALGAYPPGMIPPPAVPPTNKRKRLVFTLAFLLVAAIAITFTIVHNQKTATTAANVGDCIKVTSASLVDPKTEQAPCTDANALFMVTETGGSDVKCDPNEPSYVQGKDTNDPSARVCLRYNLAVGDCLDEGLLDTSVPKKVDCSTPTTSTAKLVSIDLTSADESKCAAGTKPLPLVKRNIVYCFGDPS